MKLQYTKDNIEYILWILSQDGISTPNSLLELAADTKIKTRAMLQALQTVEKAAEKPAKEHSLNEKIEEPKAEWEKKIEEKKQNDMADNTTPVSA